MTDQIVNTITLKDYKPIEQVGTGSYGTVLKVKNKRTDEVFAMKEIKIGGVNRDIILSTSKREIQVLSEVDHNRLVKFYGTYFKDKKLSILIEYMDKLSLRDHLEDKGLLNSDEASFYTKAVLEGLIYLHSKDIIHRDIKCGNILLNSNGDVKLGDFGMSKISENAEEFQNQTFCGTYRYMSPELIQDQPYSKLVDIWALGVTVVEMLTGYPIYPKLSPVKFKDEISDPDKSVETNIIPLSKKLSYFLQLTFYKNTILRPNASDLIHCKFITESTEDP